MQAKTLNNTSDSIRKIIIIGAGPAGTTAAIQLKRYGMDVLLIDKEMPGGLLKNANLIENYLGFPSGIRGKDFCKLIQKQLEKFRIEFRTEKVLSIDYNDRFILKTIDNVYKSEYLILATGTKAIHAYNSTIDENLRKKIFYEVENLSNISGKNIIIIGGGDAAFDYALTLSDRNNVVVIHRKSNFKAIPALIDKVRANHEIKLINNAFLKSLSQGLTNIQVEYQINDTLNKIECDFLLFAIGREPNHPEICFNQQALAGKKFFMAGDITNGIFRQATIASGDGLRVAMSIYQLILNENK